MIFFFFILLKYQSPTGHTRENRVDSCIELGADSWNILIDFEFKYNGNYQNLINTDFGILGNETIYTNQDLLEMHQIS